MIVIVAGGRDYVERREDMPWLKTLADIYGFTGIVHGGAKGADQMGSRLADALALSCDVHPVPAWVWETYGRGAGPARNMYMVVDCGAEAAIVFPGGRGTADLEGRARAAGLRIFRPHRMEAE